MHSLCVPTIGVRIASVRSIGRLRFLAVVTAIVVFTGGQLPFVIERGRTGALTSLGDAL